MRLSTRAGLSTLAMVIALVLVLVGATLNSNASDLAPGSRGAASAVLAIAAGGLALSACLVGALLNNAERLALVTFSAVVLVDGALLVVLLSHSW